MAKYDINRPYFSDDKLQEYVSIDADTTRRYGKKVKAIELSNMEYKPRFNRLGSTKKMKEPPGTGRIFPGFLVVRRVGTVNEYETWMPDHVFEELYST